MQSIEISQHTRETSLLCLETLRRISCRRSPQTFPMSWKPRWEWNVLTATKIIDSSSNLKIFWPLIQSLSEDSSTTKRWPRIYLLHRCSTGSCHLPWLSEGWSLHCGLCFSCPRPSPSKGVCFSCPRPSCSEGFGMCLEKQLSPS